MKDSISKVLEDLGRQSALEESGAVNPPHKERMLAITKETGEMLNMILRLKNAKNMLEIGMSVGYSTIWCAEAIMDNQGSITAIEQNPNKIKRAMENFQKAGLSETITIMEGMAMDILVKLSSNQQNRELFDVVLIDADKENVIEYFDLVLPMVPIGGVIITDNMLYPEKFREGMKKFASRLRADPRLRTITSPIGNGEEITIRMK